MGRKVHKLLSLVACGGAKFYCGNLNNIDTVKFVFGDHLDKKVTCLRCIKQIKKNEWNK